MTLTYNQCVCCGELHAFPDDTPKMSEDVETAMTIDHYLFAASGYTQDDFVSDLRKLNNAITDLFSKLLEPRGYGGWKLILKRTQPGAPRREVPGLFSHYYDLEVEERGKRGAVKRLAQEFKMNPAAIRSALRREAGTHGKRRKRGGRK